jgi:hypothetical protein
MRGFPERFKQLLSYVVVAQACEKLRAIKPISIAPFYYDVINSPGGLQWRNLDRAIERHINWR